MSMCKTHLSKMCLTHGHLSHGVSVSLSLMCLTHGSVPSLPIETAQEEAVAIAPKCAHN